MIDLPQRVRAATLALHLKMIDLLTHETAPAKGRPQAAAVFTLWMTSESMLKPRG
jgi:hypothetical protein